MPVPRRRVRHQIRHGPGRVYLDGSHTEPKHGVSRSQARAKVAAEKAIDRWCRNNPVDCSPAAQALPPLL